MLITCQSDKQGPDLEPVLPVMQRGSRKELSDVTSGSVVCSGCGGVLVCNRYSIMTGSVALLAEVYHGLFKPINLNAGYYAAQPLLAASADLHPRVLSDSGT